MEDYEKIDKFQAGGTFEMSAALPRQQVYEPKFENISMERYKMPEIEKPDIDLSALDKEGGFQNDYSGLYSEIQNLKNEINNEASTNSLYFETNKGRSKLNLLNFKLRDGVNAMKQNKEIAKESIKASNDNKNGAELATTREGLLIGYSKNEKGEGVITYVNPTTVEGINSDVSLLTNSDLYNYRDRLPSLRNNNTFLSNLSYTKGIDKVREEIDSFFKSVGSTTSGGSIITDGSNLLADTSKNSYNFKGLLESDGTTKNNWRIESNSGQLQLALNDLKGNMSQESYNTLRSQAYLKLKNNYSKEEISKLDVGKKINTIIDDILVSEKDRRIKKSNTDSLVLDKPNTSGGKGGRKSSDDNVGAWDVTLLGQTTSGYITIGDKKANMNIYPLSDKVVESDKLLVNQGEIMPFIKKSSMEIVGEKGENMVSAVDFAISNGKVDFTEDIATSLVPINNNTGRVATTITEDKSDNAGFLVRLIDLGQRLKNVENDEKSLDGMDGASKERKSRELLAIKNSIKSDKAALLKEINKVNPDFGDVHFVQGVTFKVIVPDPTDGMFNGMFDSGLFDEQKEDASNFRNSYQKAIGDNKIDGPLKRITVFAQFIDMNTKAGSNIQNGFPVTTNDIGGVNFKESVPDSFSLPTTLNGLNDTFKANKDY
jgi:hypothetical protein